MIKRLLVVTIFIISALSISTQSVKAQADSTDGWKFNGIFSITASQVSFSNWAAGGENSYSLNGLAALGADYKKGKGLWENDLILGYGLMKQGDKEVRKTDDKIELSSKYSYEAANHWSYSALLNFNTQFSDGYKYDDKNDTKTLVSTFFAPAYLNVALGMTYKPCKAFNLFIGPLSGKTTFVMDDDLSNAGAFGVDPGENTKSEFGGKIKAEVNTEIMKNVNLLSTLGLFSNYTEKPQNIDVDWQLLLSMKINKWLSANVSLHMIYDDDIKSVDEPGAGPEVQFKEVFGLGLSYKF